MSILKDFYNENITPFERPVSRTPEYQKLTEQIKEAEQNLFSELSENKQIEYDKCVSLILDRVCISEEELFIYAFSLGAQTMIEVLHGCT